MNANADFDAPNVRQSPQAILPLGTGRADTLESQKSAAIHDLLDEVGAVHPGDYSPREKLLEILQLERVIGLRNKALDSFRRTPSMLATGPSSAEAANRAVALRTSVWLEPDIPVSWDVDAATFDHYSRERELVRQAVRLTWERASAVRFTGWERSTNGSRGIRIQINDENPHVKRLGRFLDGMPAGMVLNFTFGNWCPDCDINRDNSIQFLAVHEFGHALGFAHEHNRPDAPAQCQEQRQGEDGDWRLTVYDPQSVMNYCNPRWINDGQLSILDMRAVRILYGNPREEAARLDAPFARPLQGANILPLPAATSRPDRALLAAPDGNQTDRGEFTSNRPPPAPTSETPAPPDSVNAPRPPPPTEAPLSARSSRVCLVSASTRRMQGDPWADLNRIENVIRFGCGESDVRYSPPSGIEGPTGNFGAVGISSKAQLFQTISAGPSDLSNATLVCYLKLHGGTDRANQEHFFELDGSREKVFRSEVIRVLRDRRARFTVLITDSCSMAEAPSPAVAVNALGYPRELFEALFVATPSDDYVDINSSTHRDENGQVLNQAAWMDEVGNGIFTQAFAECFAIRGEPQTRMLQAVTQNNRITWRTFLYGYLRGQTDDKFQDLRARALQNGLASKALEDQQNQFPIPFHLVD